MVLVKFDTEVSKNSNSYYIDSLEVRRECSNFLGFLNLIRKMVNEAIKKGFYDFSMYTRSEVSYKLIKILLNKFPCNIGIKRTIKGNWYGTEELYDYIEGTVRPINGRK